MALPAQYARIALNFFDGGGKVWQNILYFELTGSFSPTFDIAAAANAFEAHINTTLLATLSSDVLYLGLDMRLNNNGVTSDASTYPASAGTAAAGPSPNEVAAIVHTQTAHPGGSGRGRIFLAGFPAAFITGGRLTTGANTAISAFATALMSSFSNQGLAWGLRLLSRKDSTMYAIASFVVDVLVGTQRRRRPKR